MVASSGYDTHVLVVGSGPTAAILPEPNAEKEVFARDPVLYNQATTRPRAKIPHAWLVGRDGPRKSTLDVTGRGSFTLLTGLAGSARAKAARAFNLPFLRVVATGAPDAQDLYCAWQRLREIDEAGALLIRPDGHVAWRAKSGADEHEAQNQLRQALEAILAKPLSDIQPVAPSANFTTAKHSAPELFA